MDCRWILVLSNDFLLQWGKKSVTSDSKDVYCTFQLTFNDLYSLVTASYDSSSGSSYSSSSTHQFVYGVSAAVYNGAATYHVGFTFMYCYKNVKYYYIATGNLSS